MNNIRIVIAGPKGVGKTTAISCVSETTPVRTLRAHSEHSGDNTVAFAGMLDYGEMTLASGRTVKLFGTPGEAHFASMRRSMAQGAWGAIVLIDNSRPAPLEDLAEQLSSFADLISAGRVVVGIGRTETHPEPSMDRYNAYLATARTLVPLRGVDVRQRDDVLLLLNLLMFGN